MGEGGGLAYALAKFVARDSAAIADSGEVAPLLVA